MFHSLNRMLCILTNLDQIECYDIPTEEITLLQETGHIHSSKNFLFRSPTEETKQQYK